MILSVQKLSKSFGEDVILHDASFHLEDREKAAVVGINGAGKSTLLKLIVGEESADSGEAVIARGRSVGYLAQYQRIPGDMTVRECLLSSRAEILEMERRLRAAEAEMETASGDELAALMDSYARMTHTFEEGGGYALRSEVTGILKGLGFSEDEFDKPVSVLSGGQATRVSLGKLLLTKPDLILLDEPTNHLDISSIAWLETYLMNYPGAVLIVSHDRYFLNRVVTKVIEVESGTLTVFSGNYAAYAEKKAQLREVRMKAWLNQQAEIKHQEAVIEKLRSFNREKSIKRAESREKALEKVDRLEKPQELKTDMRLTLEPEIVSGNVVLETAGLSKSYGPQTLFAGADIAVRRGERVAVIGRNGTGKSTLLKIVCGDVRADAGSVRLGANVAVGYYDQETHVLHDEKTLFEELQDEHPDMNNTRVRSLLAAFLFTGDDVFKRIGDLSGGERGRVSLAKLMLSRANFLLLDEPTNHLDIQSKEILEEALRRYTGTVLFVSHDRYFVNRVATRILELDGETFTSYGGDYDYYLEKKAEKEAAAEAARDVPVRDTAAKTDWKAQKERQARQRKLRADFDRAEELIARTEEKIAALDEALTDPAVFTDAARLLSLQKERTELEETLEDAYARWEELSGLLEEEEE